MFSNVEVMDLLLRIGGSSECIVENGTTALHVAAASGACAAIKLLLDDNFRLEARSSDGGQTPLLEATHWCRTSAAEVLLDAGADINAQDSNGETALHHATFLLNHETKHPQAIHPEPCLKLLRLLLTRGANPNVPNHAGATVLHKAVKCEETPSDKVERTMSGAQKACDRGDIEAVKLLLHSGAAVNARDVEGVTVLHRAAHEWNTEMIQIVLDAGGNLEARKLDGSTPLFETISLVQASEVPPVYRRFLYWTGVVAMEMMLDAGANVNARKNNGQMMLHQLVETVRDVKDTDERDAILILLERGVDLKARDDNNETALQLAERLGKMNMVELLKGKV